MNTEVAAKPTEIELPPWFYEFLGIDSIEEGEHFTLNGTKYEWRNGLPRSISLLSNNQAQTEETFGFKWKKRDTFDSPASLSRMREWLIERYGDIGSEPWMEEHSEAPLLLDAGCGAGMSALELLRPIISKIRYLGIDVSEAVDVALSRFNENDFSAGFMQADICNLPFPEESVDIILSEGVLHHTDSTKNALQGLSRLLKPGGRFMFYVYKKKGPVREYTDDYIREKLQSLEPEGAWKMMEPLTQLGISLGELDVEIDIPEPIEILDIPSGRINLQRLFYWHVAKMFYSPDLTFDEMNHINFDWYAPANAYRQSPEDVREWCQEVNLVIEREVVEEAGITIIARKEV